jgi:predicted nucleic acid-binding protein
MPYLIDADFVIQAIRGRPSTMRTLSRVGATEVSVCWLTIGEVYEGAYVSTNPSALLSVYRAFLSAFPTVGLNDGVMELYAETRAFLRRHGRLISDMDLLVGATALFFDFTLLTYNRRHFERIPGLRVHPSS